MKGATRHPLLRILIIHFSVEHARHDSATHVGQIMDSHAMAEIIRTTSRRKMSQFVAQMHNVQVSSPSAGVVILYAIRTASWADGENEYDGGNVATAKEHGTLK